MMADFENIVPPITGNELTDSGFSVAPDTTADSGQLQLIPLSKADSQPIKYALVRQGVATNKLTEIKTGRVETNGTYKGNGDFNAQSNTLVVSKGGFALELEKATSLVGFRSVTHRLFWFLILKFTQNENETPISVTLDEYMAMRGLTDRKEAKKTVVEDLETLWNAYIYYSEKKGKNKDGTDKIVKHTKVRMLDAQEVNYYGDFKVRLGATLAENLRKYPIMYFPVSALKINPQYFQYAFTMLVIILAHKRMNAGKPNADIISVKTLLEGAGFPSYEEVSNNDRHIEKRIIEPFRKNLEALSDYFYWEFYRPKSKPFTEEELANFGWEQFAPATIHIHWKDYPDMTKHLEARKNEIRKAKRREAYKRKKAEEKAQAEARQGRLI